MSESLRRFEVVTVDRAGREVDRAWHEAREIAIDLGGGVTLETVAVPGGAFQMGSRAGAGFPDEYPLHRVAVGAFSLGKYPVTQEQWRAVMGKAPLCRFAGARRPVDGVSWLDALAFCRRLAVRTGQASALPSEAQWEYACRAGTITPFACGETITTALANHRGEPVFASEPPGVYRHETMDAGAFPPNAFGLYDMHGNLWEWCADRWHDDYTGAPGDDSAWEHGGDPVARVARGGSWHDGPALCRSAARLRAAEGEGDEMYGFRVAASMV